MNHYDNDDERSHMNQTAMLHRTSSNILTVTSRAIKRFTNKIHYSKTKRNNM